MNAFRPACRRKQAGELTFAARGLAITAILTLFSLCRLAAAQDPIVVPDEAPTLQAAVDMGPVDRPKVIFVKPGVKAGAITLDGFVAQGREDLTILIGSYVTIGGGVEFVDCKNVRFRGHGAASGSTVDGPVVVRRCREVKIELLDIKGGAWVRDSLAIELLWSHFTGTSGAIVRDCFDQPETQLRRWRQRRSFNQWVPPSQARHFGTPAVRIKTCRFAELTGDLPAVLARASHVSVETSVFTDLPDRAIEMSQGSLGWVASANIENVRRHGIALMDSEGAVLDPLISGVGPGGTDPGAGIEFVSPAVAADAPQPVVYVETYPGRGEPSRIRDCAAAGVVISGGRGRLRAKVESCPSGMIVRSGFGGYISGECDDTSLVGLALINTDEAVQIGRGPTDSLSPKPIGLNRTMGPAGLLIVDANDVDLYAVSTARGDAGPSSVWPQHYANDRPTGGGAVIVDSNVRCKFLRVGYGAGAGGLSLIGSTVEGYARLQGGAGPGLVAVGSSFSGTLDISHNYGAAGIIGERSTVELNDSTAKTNFGGGFLVDDRSRLQLNNSVIRGGPDLLRLHIYKYNIPNPPSTRFEQLHPVSVALSRDSRLVARQSRIQYFARTGVLVGRNCRADLSGCYILGDGRGSIAGVPSRVSKHHLRAHELGIDGLLVRPGGSAKFEQGRILMYCGNAARVLSGGRLEVERCNVDRVAGMGGRGISVSYGHGVEVEPSGEAVIENNLFDINGVITPPLYRASGVYVQRGGQAEIRGNLFDEVTYNPAIRVDGGTVSIQRNRFERHWSENFFERFQESAIWVESGADADIRDNDGSESEHIYVIGRKVARN